MNTLAATHPSSSSGRLTKMGSCRQCQAQDVVVQWHIGSRMFLCLACWPALVPQAASGYDDRWLKHQGTYMQLEQLRHTIYGIRVDDSIVHAADFRVVCPEHGTVVDGVNMTIARIHVIEHRDAHEMSAPPFAAPAAAPAEPPPAVERVVLDPGVANHPISVADFPS